MIRKDSVLIIAVAIALAACTAPAAELHVGPGETHTTIQSAINAAVDGDTVIVADGTYTGDGNRDIDFKGKAITVRSENGAENCIIDCQGTTNDKHRGFNFHSGERNTAIVAGLTIVNGYAPGTGRDASNYWVGGAIYCDESGPTIRNCIFRNNKASQKGGAIGTHRIIAMTVVVEDCTFLHNWSYYGGALSGACTVTRCKIIGNSGVNGGGAYGGNLLQSCLIAGNVADNHGGGLYRSYTMDCVIVGNRAGLHGGGYF